MTRIEVMRRIVDGHQHEELEGQIVDVVTAATYIRVHDAINPERQAKLESTDLCMAVDLAWKVLTKAREKVEMEALHG